ncbi:hypothetical protein [Streptomyces sp. NPDC055607]
MTTNINFICGQCGEATRHSCQSDWVASAAARQATQADPCGCGAPTTPDVVHRQDAPCYMDQDGGLQIVELPTAAARQATGQAYTTPEADVVAYRNSDRPGVLLCREHGEGWMGLTPLTADDLPDGGICTWGREYGHECGRDVLIPVNPACTNCNDIAPVVGQPAAAPDTDARPPRVQWRVEIYDPLAEEWAPGVSFPDRERAAQRLDAVQVYSPRWGTDTPPHRRLVRETTTWTVEDETRRAAGEDR